MYNVIYFRRRLTINSRRNRCGIPRSRRSETDTNKGTPIRILFVCTQNKNTKSHKITININNVSESNGIKIVLLKCRRVLITKKIKTFVR